jgi:transposase
MGEAIMAMQVTIELIGVDVSKAWLDISDGETVTRIDNARDSVRRYLRSLAGPMAIAIEATGAYHLLMMEAALSSGHKVYLVNPYQLSKYREAVGVRAKTDESDARLLYRYLAAERDRLVPFRLPPKSVQGLLRLLRARGRVTQAKTQLSLALGEIKELGPSRRALLKKMDHTLDVIDRKLMRHLTAAGYEHAYRHCLSIPGIGPLNAVGLVATYHRGQFATVDAFIAYLGLDVRVRESGKFTGKRKLTKRGDRELRRLLFNAARTAARLPQWKDHYERLRKRGLSTTAAYVALSRKLAKLAFALLRDQTTYREPLTA